MSMRQGTIIQMAVQQMVCTSCGAEANASCSCGKPYIPKKRRAAEAIMANPQKSNRAIAEDLGISKDTVRQAREAGGYNSPPEREGRDGKTYSIRRRIADDPDIPASLAKAAGATVRRRVFLRCAGDVIRKGEQGAGLRDAKRSEVDDEVLVALEKVIEVWTALRNKIVNLDTRQRVDRTRCSEEETAHTAQEELDDDIEAEIEPCNRRAAFLLRADQARQFAAYAGPVDPDVLWIAELAANTWTKLVRDLRQRHHGIAHISLRPVRS